MKERTGRTAATSAEETRIAVRLEPPLAQRFNRVVAASKRTKTSIVEECLEEVLPKLEKLYGKAMAA